MWEHEMEIYLKNQTKNEENLKPEPSAIRLSGALIGWYFMKENTNVVQFNATFTYPKVNSLAA